VNERSMPERRARQRLSLVALALVVVCVVAALTVGDHLARHASGRESTPVPASELFRDRVILWVCALGALSALGVALVHERSQARRIADRSDELERLSAELLRANRAKSEFLANVSHELRTPLAAVVGFIDLLRDGAYGDLAPRQVAPVERIESSANHLRELVDQILDLSKLAAGRLEVSMESLSLRAFVIDVVSEVEPLLNEKRLSLSIAVPATLPKVDADPTHLRQILVNLLGNAAKFTATGTVTIRAFQVPDGSIPQVAGRSRRRPLLAEGGSFIALQVSDTGGGIAERDHERIFEEFEQVNAGPRGDSIRRGTGLGLSISRRLARLLGGDITVESELEAGATFTIWLPLDVVEPRPATST
jgi:signal transduction histidine kinase